MKGFDIEGKIDAIVKYYAFFGGNFNRNRLCLSETHIDDCILKYLVETITKYNIYIEELDLSRNAIRDEGCAYIADLLSSENRIRDLSLSQNLYISRAGFDKILNSISNKQNNTLETLNFKLCSICIEIEGWDQ